MGREIKKEYLIVTGILLVLLTSGWLYFSDIRSTFDLQPNIFYIVEDRLADNGQLRISTRGNDYGETKDLLLWRYDGELMTLYKNNNVLVRSQWLVKGYKLKREGTDSLSYEGDQSEKVVNIYRTRTYNNGIFNETTVINPTATFEQFPSSDIVTFESFDEYKHSLTWRLDRVEFSDSIEHGKYYGCEINTTNNVKINWCKEKSKVNYAFVDKTRNRLSVYFLYAAGNQKLDITVVDPASLIYFQDNFDDGDYTTNPTWTVISGTFSAASNNLKGTGTGTGTGADRISSPNVITDFTSLDVNFIVNRSDTSIDVDVFAFTHSSDTYFEGNGYGFRMESSGTLKPIFGRVSSGGGFTNLISGSDGDLILGVDNNIAINFSGSTWTMWVNGTNKGTYSELIYNDSLYFAIWIESTNTYIDNIVVSDPSITALDINFSSINGYTTEALPSFSQSGDGNLIVNFTLIDYNAQPSILDFNLSLRNLAGTSYPIFSDLNLMQKSVDRVWSSLGDKGTALRSMAVYDGNLFTGDTDGVLGTYADGVWTSLGDKGTSINAMAVYDGNLFTGSSDGNVSTYAEGVWTSLGDKGESINVMAVYDGNLFTGHQLGVLGTYADGVWTSLGDKGSHLLSMAIYDGNLFTGDGIGVLGTYNSTSNVWTAITNVGVKPLNFIIAYDVNIFTGDSDGVLGTYNSTYNVWTSLGDKGGGLNSMAIYEGNIFTGHSDGVLGTYGPLYKYFITSPTVDFNSTGRGSVNFDFTSIPDGNYFVDLNVFNGVDLDSSSSDFSFTIDNTTAPITTSDANSGWQNTDANVNLTCTDSSGCFSTAYRIDSDDTNSVSIGAWQVWDGNGLFFYQDGNFAFDFNSTDTVGNIETTNRSYVTLDVTTPVLSDPQPSINQNTSDTTPDLNVAFTEAHPSYCTVTPIVNDVNGSDVNATLTAGRCLYTSSALNEADTIKACFVMADLAGNISSELCTSIYTIPASYYFGNVLENYLTDTNEAVFYPSSLVDYNVTPYGQNDTNGFWQFENVSLGDTNVSVIMRNRRALFNFEQDWVKWKRVPNTDALLALSDTNSYKGTYALNLRVDADLNFADNNTTAIWINNQFTWDINSEYYADANLSFQIKVTDVNQISDINVIIGNNSKNYISQDLNQLQDSNLTSGIWFNWIFDLNQTGVGTVNWGDVNYISIQVNEVVGASDFNVLIDDLVVTSSTNPINNWGNGSSFCIDDDNLMAGCLDLNVSSPANIVPSSTSGVSNSFWIWGDFNLTNYTPFDLFEFDFNWSFGGIPTTS